ncbi:MAG TPA: excinuclease ABC subunit UvrC, partial [Candidatus Sulfotelmatobacter sp.]|nr:excinuclease ABC subunit UvrC [Candidatus Sulfotelmatobacter sp.]
MTAVMSRPVRLVDNSELLRERLRAAPEGAGVYLLRDTAGRVAYVGKAANVRARLRSYFTGRGSQSERTGRLVDSVFDFEVIACLNAHEALVLENTLIKRYRPRFNVRLKDDKNYLYLKIPRPGSLDTFAPGTAREESRAPRGKGSDASLFPRPYYTRRLSRDGARYFGPYTSAQSLRTTVKTLRTILPFRTCSDEVFRRGRVCLDYHIRRCSGPCEAKIDPAGYARLLDEVQLFMEGHSGEVAAELRDQMDHAAARLEFELAARYRDRLRAIERLSQRQKVLGGARSDEDCLGIGLEGGRGMVGMLSVREGKVVAMETHEIEGAAGLEVGEVLSAFLTQYYGSATVIPPRVLIGEDLPDAAEVADFLSGQRGRGVELRVARRGRGRGLVEQARDSALAALRQRRIVEDFDAERTETILADLADRLGLAEAPSRIECYDISNTMGTNSVGSMIVFEDGRPKPGHYRHFKIKTVEGADDFASIEETLRRRFRRYLAGEDMPVSDPAGSNGAIQSHGAANGRRGGAESDAMEEVVDGEPSSGASRPTADDSSFGALPDLVLIDGGKGQLNAACQVLSESGLDDVPVFGLAKRNEEIYSPGRAEPILIPRDSPTLFLLQRVRDEAHRFAITHHRRRRGKAALRSKLDLV